MRRGGRRIAVLSAALLLLAGLAGASLLPDHRFAFTDEGLRRLQVESALRGRPADEVAYPARDLDPALSFAALAPAAPREGRLVSPYAPGFIRATAWACGHMGTAGLRAIPVAAAAASVLLAGWLGRRALGRGGERVAPILAFATPLPLYAMTLWDTTLLALLGLAALLALALRRGALLALAPLAASAALGPDLLPLAGGVFAAMLLDGRPAHGPDARRGTLAVLAVTLAAAGLGTLLLAHADGHPLNLARASLVRLLDPGLRLDVLDHNLLAPHPAHALLLALALGAALGVALVAALVAARGGLRAEGGIGPPGRALTLLLAAALLLLLARSLPPRTESGPWGRSLAAAAYAAPVLAAALAIALLALLPERAQARVLARAAGLSPSAWTLVAGLAIAAGAALLLARPRGHAGVVLACPLALAAALAALAPGSAARRRPTLRRLSLAALGTLGLVLLLPQSGGAGWGARYALPLYPVVAILWLAAWRDAARGAPEARRAVRTILLLALLGSAAGAAAGLRMLAGTVGDEGRLARALAESGSAVIVTDDRYLAHRLPDVYLARPLLLVKDARDLDAARTLLRARGVERFVFVHTTLGGFGSDLARGGAAIGDRRVVTLRSAPDG